VNVRPVEAHDRAWVTSFLAETNSARVAAHGELLYPSELPGFIAGDGLGLATYRIDGGECELVTLHSRVETQERAQRSSKRLQPPLATPAAAAST
jgi:hypothetical protein